MHRSFKIVLVSFFAVGVIVMAGNNPLFLEKARGVGNYLASVFFTDSITVKDLRTKYDRALSTGRKIKILVVPGHEPGIGGAEYKDLKERDMTVPLAEKLADNLRSNPRYEVIVARNAHSWNSDILSYFKSHEKEIASFTLSKKTEMNRLIAAGKVTRAEQGVMHGTAQPEIAKRLYGLNKWANDTNVDIMLHVHFNNYPRRNLNKPGIYQGFSVYIPDAQYSNAAATKAMATDVFKRLSSVSAVSNLPKEDAGIIGDQDLIAVGGSNTVDNVSMLIEYGYIYEPQFADAISRDIQYTALARQTFLGLQDFFTSNRN